MVSIPSENLVQFRLLNESDSIVEINALLRSAYRPLAEAGMRFAASHEDVEATRRNIADGECYLGILQGEIVSCVILRVDRTIEVDGWKAQRPQWYKSLDVATFGRFAVSPRLQGQGIGAKMMDVIENRARELGFKEIALDTSEHAHHLIKMYSDRGYRFIQYQQWDITNYRSVVLSKTL